MKHDYAILSSLLLCLPLIACGGEDDDDVGGTPTSVAGTDTDATDGTGDDTGDNPTTTSATTTASTTQTTTTASTTMDPDSTDTGDTGDDMGDDETEDDTASALSFATDVWPIIDASCGCHKSANHQSGLDMRERFAYASLVSTPATQDGNILRVAPGSPDQSYLFLKITGMAAHGSTMPPSGNLSQTNIDTIEQWIEDGAAP
jgi:hypothetical protein